MLAIYEQWLLLFSIPLYTVIILTEIIASHWQHKRYYTWKDTVQNIYLMLLNSGLDIFTRSVSLLVLTYFFNLHIVSFTEKSWLYWLLLLIAQDFMYYWLHRLDHLVRFFWATHVTHHSSPVFNLTVGFRSSVFQPLYRFIYFIPLAIAGFHPLDIALIYSATQIWGILVHTNYVKKMGVLEYILVTPSHHRVHHASNVLYLDRNMGMFLIVWDRLFGTFQEELPAHKYEPIQFGLTKPLAKETPAQLVFHEWIDLWHTIKQPIPLHLKFKYLIMPPGWSHDGSSKTSEELRREMFITSAKTNAVKGDFETVQNNAFT
ncbi:MAG: sterol desaturase family protein [Bacteroidetes bacterium]|nr:MAG: sterol desaturase family protein [Bacteroidota bacterium]